MGYKNTTTLAFEVERQLSGDYNISAHGDLGAFYESVTNANLPAYTAMFYHASEHEMLSEFKYDKIELGYDKGLKNTRDALQGAPIEAYIPQSFVVPDGVGGKSEHTIVRSENPPKKSIVDEIAKAQAELLGKRKVALKITEMEEELHLKRRVRKIELVKV